MHTESESVNMGNKVRQDVYCQFLKCKYQLRKWHAMKWKLQLFSYCMLIIIPFRDQCRTVLSCRAWNVKAHHIRWVSVCEFPTLPSFCVLASSWSQVGISHDVVESASVFLCDRDRKREKNVRNDRACKRRMQVDKICLPIPENEWEHSWGFFYMHGWFGHAFLGALQSP